MLFYRHGQLDHNSLLSVKINMPEHFSYTQMKIYGLSRPLCLIINLLPK